MHIKFLLDNLKGRYHLETQTYMEW